MAHSVSGSNASPGAGGYDLHLDVLTWSEAMNENSCRLPFWLIFSSWDGQGQI
jgi:hypothetical protein